jgi:hypothetical protein
MSRKTMNESAANARCSPHGDRRTSHWNSGIITLSDIPVKDSPERWERQYTSASFREMKREEAWDSEDKKRGHVEADQWQCSCA